MWKGGHNRERISVQEICVGARLCKVALVCLLLCVGDAFRIRRQYRTEFELVGRDVCLCVWVKVLGTSHKQH